MRISVFGLGYVGAVTAACLAELGHEVLGVDVSPEKVDAINRGESPIVEELIGELIAAMAASGRLRATTDAAAAVAGTEISLVCVGTPSEHSGKPNLDYIERVATQIGTALRDKADYHVVVVRSTILPGSMAGTVLPAIARAAGGAPGPDYGLCFHPEFLREGSSVRDFREPPKIVIGAGDERVAAVVSALYRDFTAPLFITAIETAELVKYADNAWHALKVVFGNEVGTLGKALGIDSHEVMRIFCRDTRLNISPAYLMPGFAYGGSCLPKDLRAINFLARQRSLELPVITAIQPSNERHLHRALDLVLGLGDLDIGVLGLSFKTGTDDLRESPLVELVERLIGKGRRVRIHDENVSLARLRGGNKAYIEERLPHISELLVPDAEAVVAGAGVIIVGAAAPAYAELLAAKGRDKKIVDLVRFTDHPPACAAYYGICW
jgi:GDP-mannose 6-dehydrogenase